MGSTKPCRGFAAELAELSELRRESKSEDAFSCGDFDRDLERPCPAERQLDFVDICDIDWCQLPAVEPAMEHSGDDGDNFRENPGGKPTNADSVEARAKSSSTDAGTELTLLLDRLGLLLNDALG